VEIKTNGKIRKARSRGEASLLTQTRGLLRRYGLRAKKGLGQHFLVDEEVLKLVVSSAQLTTDDTVIEIGPGLGVLTRELAGQAGRVIAVELDDRLAAILQQNLSSYSNITVINADVLKIDPETLLEGLREKASLAADRASGYKVVANLPYYITSPVLRHFLEASLKPKMMVVMVQKEVAEEIVAEPGRMSLLSVGVQLYGRPEMVGRVPAGCFYPTPKVDSAIVRITPYPQPVMGIDDTVGFFSLVRAGFSAARKQMGNSLAQGLAVPKSEATFLLEKAGIEARRRAETLTLEEWARLWRIFTRTE